MPKLGPGESLTSGGYIRNARGNVLVPSETFAFMRAKAAFGDFVGKTMAEIAAALGNCDPVPATDVRRGYVHTWSRPGYELRVTFNDHDNTVRSIETKRGGVASPGLKARLAEEEEAAAEAAAAAAPLGR